MKPQEIKLESSRIEAYIKYTPSMLIEIATKMIGNKIIALEFDTACEYGSTYLRVSEYRMETEEEAESRTIKEKEDQSRRTRERITRLKEEAKALGIELKDN